MSNLAQLLQEDIHNKNIMEHIMNELVNKEYSIANDIKVSYSLINTAQQTLSDLDKSIDELSLLVENLRNNAYKLSGEHK